MNNRKKLLLFGTAALSIILIVIGSLYFTGGKDGVTDGCSIQDRQNNNCVPKGRCGPTPEIDATLDCEPKNYDSKFCQSGNPKDCLGFTP